VWETELTTQFRPSHDRTVPERGRGWIERWQAGDNVSQMPRHPRPTRPSLTCTGRSNGYGGATLGLAALYGVVRPMRTTWRPGAAAGPRPPQPASRPATTRPGRVGRRATTMLPPLPTGCFVLEPGR